MVPQRGQTARSRSGAGLCFATLLFVAGTADVAWAAGGLPTFAPSSSPAAPTMSPTQSYTGTSAPYVQFARLTASACAENLQYGPLSVEAGAAKNESGAYFSTRDADYMHDVFVALYDPGPGHEQDRMRITWIFSSVRTLADRFDNAVAYGEGVSWAIHRGPNAINGTFPDDTLSGIWYFSTDSGVDEDTFDGRSGLHFSRDGGAWGAANGIVNGALNGISPEYGVANQDGDDSAFCPLLMSGGNASYFPNMTVEFYAVRNGTFNFQDDYTYAPTLSPTQAGFPMHFATLSTTRCAELLPYGPVPVSTGVGIYGAFLSTNRAAELHTSWTQKVYTSGSTAGTPDMLIRWDFYTSKSLEARFANAVANGEPVLWTVYTAAGGSTPVAQLTGTWRFSNNAGDVLSRFGSSGTSFSNDDGCWGAPTSNGGTVDGNFGGNVGYGVCNYNSGDSSQCGNFYVSSSSTYYSTLVTTMHLTNNSFNTLAPSLAPSMVPTLTLTPQPTFSPTPFRNQSTFLVQFASLSSSQCAESLAYGPSSVSDGVSIYGAYMSTELAYETHSSWQQFIYATGSGTPTMQINWQFFSSKTLAARFADAVSTGEPVLWTVYTAASGSTPVAQVTGTWRYSNNAGITESKFTGSGTRWSNDDGCWGAPSSNGGTVDGNFGGNVAYGICNYNSGDSTCGYLYESSSSTYYSSLVSTLYLNGFVSAAPSAAPTSQPTAPTPIPTMLPTSSPTPAINASFPLLFASLSASRCAESLPYGPSTVETGVSQYGAFLTTLARDEPHTSFRQLIFASGGSGKDWDMKIEWQFHSGSKTLAERFADAVSSGEEVTWRVYTPGVSAPTSEVSGTWRYSNSAGVSESTFDGSGTGFSNDDGCWGSPATNGATVDGNAGGIVANGFCNYNSGDSGCANFYQDSIATYYSTLVGRMYLMNESFESLVPSVAPTEYPSALPSIIPTDSPSDAPTFVPTANPTRTAMPTTAPSTLPTTSPTSVPTKAPSKRPSAIPTANPTGLPSAYPTTLPTVYPSDAPTTQPTVSPAPSEFPSPLPSGLPTMQPTAVPSTSPTRSMEPSAQPSALPSALPSMVPTQYPTGPTPQPSPRPTLTPSNAPTAQPTPAPTNYDGPSVAEVCGGLFGEGVSTVIGDVNISCTAFDLMVDACPENLVMPPSDASNSSLWTTFGTSNAPEHISIMVIHGRGNDVYSGGSGTCNISIAAAGVSHVMFLGVSADYLDSLQVVAAGSVSILRSSLTTASSTVIQTDAQVSAFSAALQHNYTFAASLVENINWHEDASVLTTFPETTSTWSPLTETVSGSVMLMQSSLRTTASGTSIQSGNMLFTSSVVESAAFSFIAEGSTWSASGTTSVWHNMEFVGQDSASASTAMPVVLHSGAGLMFQERNNLSAVTVDISERSPRSASLTLGGSIYHVGDQFSAACDSVTIEQSLRLSSISTPPDDVVALAASSAGGDAIAAGGCGWAGNAQFSTYECTAGGLVQRSQWPTVAPFSLSTSFLNRLADGSLNPDGPRPGDYVQMTQSTGSSADMCGWAGGAVSLNASSTIRLVMDDPTADPATIDVNGQAGCNAFDSQGHYGGGGAGGYVVMEAEDLAVSSFLMTTLFTGNGPAALRVNAAGGLPEVDASDSQVGGGGGAGGLVSVHWTTTTLVGGMPVSDVNSSSAVVATNVSGGHNMKDSPAGVMGTGYCCPGGSGVASIGSLASVSDRASVVAGTPKMGADGTLTVKLHEGWALESADVLLDAGQQLCREQSSTTSDGKLDDKEVVECWQSGMTTLIDDAVLVGPVRSLYSLVLPPEYESYLRFGDLTVSLVISAADENGSTQSEQFSSLTLSATPQLLVDVSSNGTVSVSFSDSSIVNCETGARMVTTDLNQSANQDFFVAGSDTGNGGGRMTEQIVLLETDEETILTVTTLPNRLCVGAAAQSVSGPRGTVHVPVQSVTVRLPLVTPQSGSSFGNSPVVIVPAFNMTRQRVDWASHLYDNYQGTLLSDGDISVMCQFGPNVNASATVQQALLATPGTISWSNNTVHCLSAEASPPLVINSDAIREVEFSLAWYFVPDTVRGSGNDDNVNDIIELDVQSYHPFTFEHEDHVLTTTSDSMTDYSVIPAPGETVYFHARNASHLVVFVQLRIVNETDGPWIDGTSLIQQCRHANGTMEVTYNNFTDVAGSTNDSQNADAARFYTESGGDMVGTFHVITAQASLYAAVLEDLNLTHAEDPSWCTLNDTFDPSNFNSARATSRAEPSLLDLIDLDRQVGSGRKLWAWKAAAWTCKALTSSVRDLVIRNKKANSITAAAGSVWGFGNSVVGTYNAFKNGKLTRTDLVRLSYDAVNTVASIASIFTKSVADDLDACVSLGESAIQMFSEATTCYLEKDRPHLLACLCQRFYDRETGAHPYCPSAQTCGNEPKCPCTLNAALQGGTNPRRAHAGYLGGQGDKAATGWDSGDCIMIGTNNKCCYDPNTGVLCGLSGSDSCGTTSGCVDGLVDGVTAGVSLFSFSLGQALGKAACVGVLGGDLVTDLQPHCNIPETVECTENPGRAGGSGDPHFVSFDGKRFDLQLWGDAVMAQVGDDFAVHGRMASPGRTCATVTPGSTATVFTAISVSSRATATNVTMFREGGTRGVVVMQPDEEPLWISPSTSYSKYNDLNIYRSGSQTRVVAGGLQVTYTTPYSMEVRVDHEYYGQTRGVLGVWNGDVSDEFTRPDGDIVPIDASFQDIYTEFGEAWRAPYAASRISYDEPGETWETHACLSYVPNFGDLTGLVNDSVLAEYEELCETVAPNTVEDCVTELVLMQGTGVDTETSAEYMGDYSEAVEEQENLNNLPPVFTAPRTSILYFEPLESVNLTFTVLDLDGENSSVSAAVLPPGASVTPLATDGKSYLFTWLPVDNTPYTVEFVASDSVRNVSKEVELKIIPTLSPTGAPTFVPTNSPSSQPTAAPTGPTPQPTLFPSAEPTVEHTPFPSQVPSVGPTLVPSLAPSWTPKTFSAVPQLASSFSRAHRAVTGDVDGDGVEDMLVSDRRGDAVYIMYGEGGGDFSAPSVVMSINRPFGVLAESFFGDDSALDVVVVGDDSVVAYAVNDGSGNFSAVVLDSDAGNPRYCAAGDMDSDGDLDLVVSLLSAHAVVWYENNGTQFDSSANLAYESDHDLFGAGPVFVEDFDGDCSSDILIVATSASFISVLLNVDGTGEVFELQRVGQLSLRMTAIPADIDSDGNMDVVAFDAEEHRFVFIRGQGDGTFDSPLPMLNAHPARDAALAVGDLDGDCDIDVAAASESTSTVLWIENKNGLGTEWNSTLVDTQVPQPRDIGIDDLDGDSNYDLYVSGNEESMRIYYGDGGQSGTSCSSSAPSCSGNT